MLPILQFFNSQDLNNAKFTHDDLNSIINMPEN